MELRVNIVGPAKSGKSTVAKILADALNKLEIPVEVDDGLDRDYGRWQTDKVASLLKQGSSIVKVKTETERTK